MKQNQRAEDSPREYSSRSPIFYGKNQKILLFVGLLLLVIYHFGRPSFEKMLGIELPQLIADGSENRDSNPVRDSNETKPATKEKIAKNKESATSNSKFRLEKAGGDDLKSPEGLVYGIGPNREHRIDHVLRHGVDDPSRPVHSVFSGNRDEVLATIDEAYRLMKQKSPQARTQNSPDGDNRTESVIDLKRPIGYRGGKNGARDGFPELFKIKLILEDSNRVITAFPF